MSVKESTLRKMKSIEILKSYGIPFLTTLPEIEDSSRPFRRESKEVAFRAVALYIVALKAEVLLHEPEENHPELLKIINDVIRKYNVEDKFTKKERTFIEDRQSDEVSTTQFSWRYEAYWVMLWALGLVDTLDYPDKICDVSEAVSIILKYNNTEEFLKKAKLRAQTELLDAADLIYRYHWATRNAQLKGEDSPADLYNSVIVERHYALNWLVGQGHNGPPEWDEVDTDT